MPTSLHSDQITFHAWTFTTHDYRSSFRPNDVAVLHQGSRRARDIVSGIVKEVDSGETLPHANIRIEGTTIGTSTNIDGHFTLMGVPGGAVRILVTYIGYRPSLVLRL
jgi:hypothetical protein